MPRISFGAFFFSQKHIQSKNITFATKALKNGKTESHI